MLTPIFAPRRSIPTQSRLKKGFTLIELGIAILVSFVVVAIALAVAGLVTTNTDAKRAEQELLVIGSAARTAFTTSSDYGTVDLTTYLANSADIPDTLKKTVSGSTTTLSNKWNGGVSVKGATTSFILSYAAMPKTVCNKILPRLKTPDWSTVTVGSTAVTLPISALAADTACAATNTVVLTAS